MLDFTLISKRAATLEDGICLALTDIAAAHGVELSEEANPGRFLQLIIAMGKEKKAAILVDEYDKPLIDHIDDLERNFPNKEVANAFSAHLLAEFSEKGEERTNRLVWQMASHLRTGAISTFMESLKSLFPALRCALAQRGGHGAGIAYAIQPAGEGGIENYEKYYHSMFYLAFRLLGYDIHVEVLTHNGRIDAVVIMKGYVYVVEFKLGDAASALAQIKERGYHLPHLGSGKTVVLLEIGFDVKTRNVGSFLVEEA
jgi:phosphatidylserine decarboxylase